jgi:hypothetical protein
MSSCVRNWSSVFTWVHTHLGQVSLGQILIKKMSWSKLSIPSSKGQRFVITQAILKIISISLYKLTMQNIWRARNDTCKNFTKYVAHYPKGLAIFINPHDFWNIYNSFVMMTWWRHQQKQFAKKTIIIFKCYCWFVVFTYFEYK